MAVYKKKINGVWQIVSTTWPVQIGSGGGGGGSNVQTIYVTPTENLSYLPLDGIVKIPEILTFQIYSEEFMESTSVNEVAAAIPSGNISNGVITAPAIPLGYSSSGLRLYFQNSTAMNRRFGTGNPTFGTQLNGGLPDAAVGWKGFATVTQAECQAQFILALKSLGYALDGSGVLCLKNRILNSTATFAAGVTYVINAVHDVTPTTAPGYITLDRTVNSTNVTETV